MTVLTQRSVAAVASPIALVADAAVRRRPGRTRDGCSRYDGAETRPLIDTPRRPRHRRQLHPAGHRRPADVRDRGRSRRASGSGHCSSTCPATREWASSWARPTSVRRSDVRGRARAALLRGRPQPVATCGTPPPGRSVRRCCPTCASVAGGPAAWDADETIRRAIEIRNGVIVNPRILTFQGRSATPPHLPL